MPKSSLKKERWTITFDPVLKTQVQKEARKLRIYPVQILEGLVRERLNPYGFQSVKDSLLYVDSIREKSSSLSDEKFLADLRKWQRN